MKRHIAWIALIVFGVFVIIGDLVYPAILMGIASRSEPVEEPIAIIGGVEAPTDIAVYLLVRGSVDTAFLALGGLSLIVGIVLAASAIRKSHQNI